MDESEPTQNDAAPADASGDAKALEEARSLIVTLREKEAQQDRNLKVMDRNLMIMQRHLSEERARVAELHGRLLGRSAVGDRAEVREEVAVGVRSERGLLRSVLRTPRRLYRLADARCTRMPATSAPRPRMSKQMPCTES